MIVMELCKNGALRECLKRKISWPLKVRLALDICQGIAFLHENGIIHRDIKTTNILVDDQWRAKLCDFSFAIHRDSHSKRSYTYGTEEFMSPEIAFALDFDLSTDIFSFGILLCEIMTDVEPSIRKPQDSFALNEEEVRTLILPGCPEALEALAFQCCEADPSKRPNVLTCVEELETILTELGGINLNNLPKVDSLILQPEFIQSMNSPEREGRVQSTKNNTLDQQKDIPEKNNTRVSVLEAEILNLREESKKMSKELHALTVVSANRDILFSKLISKVKGNAVVSNIDRDELDGVTTDVILNKLEKNLQSMETELNDVQSNNNDVDKENIIARLNILEESIHEMRLKISLAENQSEKRTSLEPKKIIDTNKDYSNNDLLIDLIDFPTKERIDSNTVKVLSNININGDKIDNEPTKKIIIDNDGNSTVTTKLKEFPIPNSDHEPTTELNKALGSFLTIIGKCSDNNNRTRELMSNLDRIADAKLSYNTPNKLKVIAANRAAANSATITPKQTLKDFTWREVETPSVTSLRSPRAESSLIQDTISKRLKSVSPTHHFSGRFSPRVSTSSSTGMSSILRNSDTELEKKAAVSKFFEPPPSLVKTSSRIDAVSTLDRSLKEKSDYNRRLVQSPTIKNPVLERFSPEKTNAQKYQDLLEQKYT